MPRRTVAVKVLPADVSDPGLRRMFNAEADVLARLSAHPSIVTIYQAGVSSDGRAYIVMEYCPGSLASRYRTEQIPVAEVLMIGVKLASALEAAHRTGVLHRDIKPSNVLTTSFGTPVLADFGIAASVAGASGTEVLAMSVPWSAPEVVAELTPGTIATETWAVAATVYSLLAGHSPFESREKGKNSRDHLQHRIARARFVPIGRAGVPPVLQQTLARAMSKDPAARFGSALEFAQALRQAQLELGQTPTALEVPVDDWLSSAAEVDFADNSSRGPVRTSVAQPRVRKAATATPLSALVRDEDTSAAAPRRATRLTALLLAGGSVLAAVSVAVGIAIGMGLR